MKILLAWRVCDIGGVETWMLGLSQALRELGHEVELFFFSRGPFEDSVPDAQVTHFGDLSAMLKLVYARRYEVVHGATIDWELGLSAVRALGPKLVLTGNGWSDPAWNSSNCDALVGCSNWNAVAQQASTDLPVQMIPNAVDVDRFRPPEAVGDGPPIVAWVGRGSDLRQKQIDRLAAVAPGLRRLGLRLWIADPDGPGKVAPNVARVLRAEAEFWGGLEPERMPSFFRDVAASGGCLLSTSRYEGLSLAYIEAQACGCPVVGPDVIGVNEGVRPEHGGVLYPETLAPDSLVQLVQATLHDEAGMDRRRRACRRFVESSFSFSKTARDYLLVYGAAPYPRLGGMSGFIRRHRCSPLVNYRKYVETCWAAGHRQYQTSLDLDLAGEGRLAMLAASESLSTCPTLYLRWRRLAHLIKCLV
ncbi:glycosyltransferase family 4 protein [Paludisphaera borealis]|nr:glycosyltransferase family 4 protein [Paludisphaera borealis]